MSGIVIVDYGMANLRSVQKALEKVGHEAVISSDPKVLAEATKLVLPGVGAFRDAIARLREADLARPIVDHIKAGKPFLGICLGLQLLFTKSYEDGEHEGLGVFEGDVVRFSSVPGLEDPPHGVEPASGVSPRTRPRRSTGRGGCLFRPLLLRSPGGPCDRRNRDGLSHALCVLHLARERICDPVPPGKKPAGRAQDPEQFRR